MQNKKLKKKTLQQVVRFFLHGLVSWDVDAMFAGLSGIASVPVAKRLLTDWFQLSPSNRLRCAWGVRELKKFIDKSLNRSSGYAWIIDFDLRPVLEDEPLHFGTRGPADAPKDLIRMISDGNDGQKFRLVNGHVLLEGRIIGDHSSTEPLQDFGLALGATKIQYVNCKNEWENYER
jgi:hypothetical protein